MTIKPEFSFSQSFHSRLTLLQRMQTQVGAEFGGEADWQRALQCHDGCFEADRF